MGCGCIEKTKPVHKHSEGTEEIYVDITKLPSGNQYKLVKIIGHGRFGRVLLGQSAASMAPVAIKVLNKTENIEKLLKEVKLLSEVDHPNIAKYFNSFQTAKYLYIVMEYCGGGDLFKMIVSKGNFTEKEAARIMSEILRAVNHCHVLGIIHRDLKPENIMVSNDGSIKIIDFGLSTSNSFGTNMNDLVGTSFYIAPEVIKSGKYTTACDIWSLGIILHILLSGYVPIEGVSNTEIMQSIMTFSEPTFSGKPWENITSSAKNLVSQMLCVNPEKRISASDAMNHPWISGCESIPSSCDLDIINSLKKYGKYSKLKKKALNLLVHYLKPQDIKKFQEAFLALDVNHTGLITYTDFQKCLKAKGYELPAEELEGMIKKVNYEGDGYVRYTDFLAAMLSTQIFFTQENLWELFKSIDVENKGHITKTELREALSKRKRVQTMELDGIMKLVDLNQDGKISFEEFKEAVAGTEINNSKSP